VAAVTRGARAVNSLGRLEELLAQATPGPWTAKGWSVNAAADLLPGQSSRTLAKTRETRGTLAWEESFQRGVADAALICAAVNALPALLACARELLLHHDCDLHVESADEGTAYCRACAVLSQLEEQ